jgi:hypothetical protein
MQQFGDILLLFEELYEILFEEASFMYGNALFVVVLSS